MGEVPNYRIVPKSPDSGYNQVQDGPGGKQATPDGQDYVGIYNQKDGAQGPKGTEADQSIHGPQPGKG